ITLLFTTPFSLYVSSSSTNIHHYLRFFLTLLSRPLLSTLFPYTTLFRSVTCATSKCNGATVAPRLTSLGRTAFAQTKSSRECSADRKSTRLNSSHVAISYAVFCLKKKKKDDRYINPHG